jgi:hypothetical protein
MNFYLFFNSYFYVVVSLSQKPSKITNKLSQSENTSVHNTLFTVTDSTSPSAKQFITPSSFTSTMPLTNLPTTQNLNEYQTLPHSLYRPMLPFDASPRPKVYAEGSSGVMGTPTAAEERLLARNRQDFLASLTPEMIQFLSVANDVKFVACSCLVLFTFGCVWFVIELK